MRKAVEHFRLLCDCLADDVRPETISTLGARLARPDLDWTYFIGLANSQYVAPALCDMLRQRGLLVFVPAAPQEFLQLSYKLNSERNIRLRTQALEIFDAFNQSYVQYVVLKGAVHLFDRDEARLGRRMMSDLDMLVPYGQLRESIVTLERLGYHSEGAWIETSHQYPPMFREGECASVEIHHELGKQRVLMPHAALSQAVPLRDDIAGAKKLSPTHQILHNFLHSELQDRRHELGIVSLRSLHDLAALCASHGASVHWGELRNLAERHGIRNHLESHVYCAYKLLGMPQPAAIGQTFRARLHYYRCLGQIRYDVLTRCMGLWGAATVVLRRRKMRSRYPTIARFVPVNLIRLYHVTTMVGRHGPRSIRRIRAYINSLLDY